jgi:hypothetical protein
MIGIEPTWVTPLDPKSSASASFATSAMGRKNRGIMISVQDHQLPIGSVFIKFHAKAQNEKNSLQELSDTIR